MTRLGQHLIPGERGGASLFAGGSLFWAFWLCLFFGDTLARGLAALRPPSLFWSGTAIATALVLFLVAAERWEKRMSKHLLLLLGGVGCVVASIATLFPGESLWVADVLSTVVVAACLAALAGWGNYFCDAVPLGQMHRVMGATVCGGIFIFHLVELAGSHGHFRAAGVGIAGAALIAAANMTKGLAFKRPAFGRDMDRLGLALVCTYAFLLNLGSHGILAGPPKASWGFHGMAMAVCLVLVLAWDRMTEPLPPDTVLIWGTAAILVADLTARLIPGWDDPARILAAAGWTVASLATFTLAGEMGYMFGRPARIFGAMGAVFAAALFSGRAVADSGAGWPAGELTALGPALSLLLIPFIHRRHRGNLKDITSKQAVQAALNTVIVADHARTLLTPKERQIYRFMCLGYQNKQIAEQAGISENTLKGHARQIYKKLKVRNKKELLARQTRGDGK